jgi:hypothetical protein
VHHKLSPHVRAKLPVQCSAAQLIANVEAQIKRQAQGYYTTIEFAMILASENGLDWESLFGRFWGAALNNELVVRDPSTGGAPIDARSVNPYVGAHHERLDKAWLVGNSWVFPADVNQLLEKWGVTYRFAWPRPWSLLAKKDETNEGSVPTLDVPSIALDSLPSPLTSSDIAFSFAGIKWPEEKWKKPLSDVPKWLANCLHTRGQRGVSSNLWNPVYIGAALVSKEFAKANSVRARFQTKPALQPWLEIWKTYEANNFSTD